MALAVAENTKPQGTDEAVDEQEPDYQIGVLAGCEWSPDANSNNPDQPYAQVTEAQKREIKMLCEKASRRDYPARLLEVIQAWEAALFYRGFQFLIPQRNGGWTIPGESTGYGPSMQMDLALLPTNIYSAQAQILISTLTRAIPTVRFEPQDGGNDAQITAAESADQFIKVIERNNDLMMIQNDACRYLYNDGRFIYWSRYELDGQRFGWEEDDEPNNLVPENMPPDNAPPQLPEAAGGIPGIAPESELGEEEPEQKTSEPTAEARGALQGAEETENEQEEKEAQNKPPRKPRGQELRTAHGKLEMKIFPMSANDLGGADGVQYETEVDVSRAKGMFPWVADDIKSGANGVTEGEIARLGRINVKLGMQSTYITSDSIADDVTIQRTWFRPSYFMHCKDKGVRDSLISDFPDGMLVVYAGETFCYAVNQAIDDALALGQAFSGDGQNRNALGTSMMPIQKRVNNWLDLLNDSFIRTVPKKWMDSKVFDVQAISKQTNVPGDIGSFKRQPGVAVEELIFVEPQVTVSPILSEFVKEYIGPISELMSGAYPALSGSSDLAGNDTKGGIEIQRNQALGRLGPTWHSIQNAEAASMRQLVRWGAKCRDKSINERIPGGEAIRLEVNNLRANILCFPESDESFPENHADKKAQLLEIMDGAAKNPQLLEELYNPANLEFLASVTALTDLYLPKVAARNKQLGEFEIILNSQPVPNPQFVKGTQLIAKIKTMGVNPQILQQAEAQLAKMPQEITSYPIDVDYDDHDTEFLTCWQKVNSPEGRKMKRTNKRGFENLRLHGLAHLQAKQQKDAGSSAGKPPSLSASLKDTAAFDPEAAVQLLQKAGIHASPHAGAPAALPAGDHAPAQLPPPAAAPAHPALPPG